MLSFQIYLRKKIKPTNGILSELEFPSKEVNKIIPYGGVLSVNHLLSFYYLNINLYKFKITLNRSIIPADFM